MVKTTPSTAAARHLMFGTDDQSITAVSPEAKSFAQHVPLFMLNTVKGDYKRKHIASNEFSPIYGVDSLVSTSKHFSRFNILAKTLMPFTTSVIQRLPGKVWDAPTSKYVDATTSSLVLYLATTDTISGSGNRYMRDSVTGKVLKDPATGERLVDDTKDVNYINMGLVVRKIKGSYTSEPITITDAGGVVTTLTPIKILKAEGHGSWYNGIGFNISPNIEDDTNTDIINNHRTITYDFTLFDKNGSKTKNIKSVEGEDSIEFTINPSAVVPITNKSLLLDDRVPAEYGNFTDNTLPLQGFTLDPSEEFNMKYNDLVSIETRLTDALETEVFNTAVPGAGDPLDVPSWVDYSMPASEASDDLTEVAEKDFGMVNFVTCINTLGVEYETIRPFDGDKIIAIQDEDPTVEFVPVSNTAVTYLANGEDSDKKFLNDVEAMELSILSEVERYSDSYDIVQSIALNKDNVLYDPGFTMETKIKLGAYISKKKNTYMGLSTAVLGEGPVSVATHTSRAVAIKSIISLNVESPLFNTPTARAFIVIGSGVLKDGSYKPRVPLLLDYATKLAKYTAALDGKWKGAYNFYAQDGNLVTLLKDIDPAYIPDPLKDKLYLSGAIWPDNEDELTFFYPLNQTIYPNSTSILNSVISAVAISTLNTVNDGLWRKYSGVKNLTDIELKLAVERDFREATVDIFDSNFVLKPEVYMTKRDKQLGWVWRLRVHFYGNVDKTYMASELVAHNIKDLEG